METFTAVFVNVNCLFDKTFRTTFSHSVDEIHDSYFRETITEAATGKVKVLWTKTSLGVKREIE